MVARGVHQHRERAVLELTDRRAMGRIVPGDVLAEHALELRGRARIWPWR